MPWKVPQGSRSGEKPSARTWAGTSAIRIGPSRSRKCSNSFGPSDHSAIARCSASVKPEVTKSTGAPASSMVAMAA